MKDYVGAQLVSLAETGALSASDLATLASLFDSGGLSSVTSLDGLPSAVQGVVRDAFLDGVRWAFLSLMPWLGVGCSASVFLGRIEDSDKAKVGEGCDVELAQARPAGGVVEAGTG